MKKYNLSKEGALMMINKGGLKIYSTMDPDIQKEVDRVFENYTRYILPQDGKYPEASCVILDPYTSDILAIAGGVGKKSANRILNRATDSKRPLGSVIKPLSVYAPAIQERVITYSTVYDDVPLYRNGDFWPHNATNKYNGLVTVNYAVEHSLNTVAVKTLNDLGIERSFDFCKNKLKINLVDDDKNEAPLALGQLTVGDSLLNVTNAYSCFANGGTLAEPRSYLYVTDNYGNVLLSNDYVHDRVIDEETASIMNQMLKNVVKNGTAKKIKLKDYVEVAGKTGTSGENKDKWFVGYTPYYLCGAWVGYDTPTPMNSGINYATTIFDDIMTSIHLGKNENEKIFVSENVVTKKICIDSGMLAGKDCALDARQNRIETGYFIKGTEPQEYCDRHKCVYIDSQSGLIADDHTHSLYKRKIALIDYVRDSIFDEFDIYDKKYLINSRLNMN